MSSCREGTSRWGAQQEGEGHDRGEAGSSFSLETDRAWERAWQMAELTALQFTCLATASLYSQSSFQLILKLQRQRALMTTVCHVLKNVKLKE